ncbi:MAG: hypothetical protein OEM63_02285 [Gammaproteobacteria bacterium]|nr:hypothetical protein [Gammaproteobacteria bacterium]
MRRRAGAGDVRLIAAAIVLLCATLPIAASEFEKWLIMPGEVTAVHAELEAECELCHSPLTDVAQADLCIACHTEISEEIALRWGLHGKLAERNQADCSVCHTDHEGRDHQITALDEENFDHSMTNFGLHGLHLEVTCTDCHTAGQSFRSAPSDCAGCHADVHGEKLRVECDACHIPGGWQFQSFDHSVTSFLLTGAHRGSTCDACHTSKDFSGASGLCIDCHRSDDVHAGRNGPQCGECHNDTTWTAVDFDHFAVTGFGLIDGHGGLACADCHRQPDHSGLGDSTCNSCHASDDVHEGRFGVQCDSCHNVTRWPAAKFDHARQAGFALPAGHKALACDSCHTGKLIDPLPIDCAGCHRDDDPHRGQLGEDCAACHVATGWVAQLWFDHDITAFPLFGSHAELDCASCHESAAFRDVDAGCNSCHADDDPHVGTLGDRCGSCHNASTWAAWSFDHNLVSDFPLTGSHALVSCSGCHIDDAESPGKLAADCNACHRRDDPHNGRFGNNCENCHNTSTFSRVEGL